MPSTVSISNRLGSVCTIRDINKRRRWFSNWVAVLQTVITGLGELVAVIAASRSIWRLENGCCIQYSDAYSLKSIHLESKLWNSRVFGVVGVIHHLWDCFTLSRHPKVFTCRDRTVGISSVPL